MSESMVEQVAKAIALAREERRNRSSIDSMACACMGKLRPDDPACKCRMSDAVDDARAAIEAMREPTLDMVDSACFAWIKLYPAFEGQKKPVLGSKLTLEGMAGLLCESHNAVCPTPSNAHERRRSNTP